MSGLICLTTELLCLLCVCEVKSQHTNVYLQSGLDPLPSFYRTAALYLFAISEAFMVTTLTARQKGEPTRAAMSEDEWD